MELNSILTYTISGHESCTISKSSNEIKLIDLLSYGLLTFLQVI